MTYALHLLVVVGIYSLLALSLNFSVGLLGLVSISQALFFGVGAYVAAFAAASGMDGFLVLSVSGGVGFLTGVLVALLLFRLGDDYFAVASFALQAMAVAFFYNLRSWTGGASGIAGIPRMKLGSVVLESPQAYATVVWVLIVLVLVVFAAIQRSPAGRVCAALREDEITVISLGINPTRYRVFLFSTGAAVASMAGAIYAMYMTFINPVPFGIAAAIMILACVILGGSGSLVGPILGAAAFVLLPEALRFVGLPSTVAANVRQILFGIALVALMVWRPQGLFGRTSLTRSC